MTNGTNEFAFQFKKRYERLEGSTYGSFPVCDSAVFRALMDVKLIFNSEISRSMQKIQGIGVVSVHLKARKELLSVFHRSPWVSPRKINE